MMHWVSCNAKWWWGGSFKMLKNQIYLLQKTILTQCFGQRTSYSAEQLSNCTAGVKKWSSPGNWSQPDVKLLTFRSIITRRRWMKMEGRLFRTISMSELPSVQKRKYTKEMFFINHISLGVPHWTPLTDFFCHKEWRELGGTLLLPSVSANWSTQTGLHA